MTTDYALSWLCIQEAKRVVLTLWADISDGIALLEWPSRAAIRPCPVWGHHGIWPVGKGCKGFFMRQQVAVLKGHRLLQMAGASLRVRPGGYERGRDDGLTAFHIPRPVAGMSTVSSDVSVAAA